MVSVTLTAVDIPGADLSELLVLFWHRYREKCLEPARDCDLSCQPSIQNTLNHLGLVPGSLGNRWKKALGSWLGLLPQHVTGMSSILRCSRSYFNRFSLFAHRLYRQVPCQTPQSHELCNPYGFSHAQVSNCPLPILPFTAILNVAIKEQPDVTSRQSNSFALVCNWLILTPPRNKVGAGLEPIQTSLLLEIRTSYRGVATWTLWPLPQTCINSERMRQTILVVCRTAPSASGRS